MEEVTIICSRCGQQVKGGRDDYFTAGFYDVSPESAWGVYGRPDETEICDSCMFSDPEYQRVYGPRDAVATEWLERE